MPLDFRRDSWTVIADLDYHAIVILVGTNSQLTLSTHRIDRIVDDVGPDLVEFAAE